MAGYEKRKHPAPFTLADPFVYPPIDELATYKASAPPASDLPLRNWDANLQPQAAEPQKRKYPDENAQFAFASNSPLVFSVDPIQSQVTEPRKRKYPDENGQSGFARNPPPVFGLDPIQPQVIAPRKRKIPDENGQFASASNPPPVFGLDPRMLPVSKKPRPDPKLNPVPMPRVLVGKNVKYNLNTCVPAPKVGIAQGKHLDHGFKNRALAPAIALAQAKFLKDAALNKCAPAPALGGTHGKDLRFDFNSSLPRSSGAHDLEYSTRVKQPQLQPQRQPQRQPQHQPQLQPQRQPQHQTSAAPSISKQISAAPASAFIDLTTDEDPQKEDHLGDRATPEWFDLAFQRSANTGLIVRDVATGAPYPQWYLNIIRKIHDPNCENENWGEIFYSGGARFIPMSDFVQYEINADRGEAIKLGLKLQAERFPLYGMTDEDCSKYVEAQSSIWMDREFGEKKDAEEPNRSLTAQAALASGAFKPGTEFGTPLSPNVKGAFIDPKNTIKYSPPQNRYTRTSKKKNLTLEARLEAIRRRHARARVWVEGLPCE